MPETTLTWADGDTFIALAHAFLDDYLVRVRLHDGLELEGYVTSGEDDFAITLREHFDPTAPNQYPRRVELDDIANLHIL